ncbi:FliO/MopB family protein [Parvibaculum lavamentivorans]|nr:FliO/MopB family protein [Parvibaculum lavamentivorans]
MEISEILRFVSALLFVIGLIAVCAWGARRLGLMQIAGKTSLGSRLAVVETLAVDSKRKLLIIRHDDREHLIMLGEQDLILDTGLPARTDLDTKTKSPSTTNMSPEHLTGSVAGQMQKVVSLLREHRA